MSLCPEEIQTLIRPIRANHDPRLTLLASMQVVAGNGMNQVLAAHGIAASAPTMRRVLGECIGAWLLLNDFTPEQYEAVVAAMTRAQQTVNILAAIPD